MILYEPEKVGNKANDHVVKNWQYFWIFSAICCIPVFLAFLLDAYLFSPGDPLVHVRWFSETIIKIFAVFFPVELYLVYRDWRMNGNLFKGIINNPLGCAIFASAVFYGVVLICASSIH